jgi:hypothetical protein
VKRNFELIRTVLLEVESWPPGRSYIDLSTPAGYDEATLFEHLELLIDAGLLEGRVLRSPEGIDGVAVRKLTWEGHDFIEAATKPDLWQKAFATVKEKGGAMTFDVLKELLKRLALSSAGLS